MKKRIWLACGSGIASANMCAHVLKKQCANRGLDVEIETLGFRDIRSRTTKPDVLVSIAPGLEKGNYTGLQGVPIVNGVCLMTGMGVDKLMDELTKLLKK